jgi:3'(2'), 5'-bisphosphate nucleotidase
MSLSPEKLVQPVREIATEASAQIMDIYGKGFNVEQKSDNSPLTAADLSSHKVIVAGLERLTPAIPIVSEESSDVPYAERAGWEYFWLVDPLDGTKEFIKRNDEFTVNIALIQGHEPILGVVVVPVTGLCYFAARGQGAFRQRPGEAARRITVRSLTEGPVRVVGSRSHRGASLDNFLARLGEHTLVTIGSSLKFCLVAEGNADVYPRLGPTSEWDTAAAQCIVEEAGGQVIDLEGKRLIYNTQESLLNPHFLVIGDSRHNWLNYLLPEVQ